MRRARRTGEAAGVRRGAGRDAPRVEVGRARPASERPSSERAADGVSGPAETAGFRPSLARFLEATPRVFRRCAVDAPFGLGFLASPAEVKYPFVYTRDLAVAIVALCELGDLAVARRACDFLLGTQLPSGEWVQRYDEAGNRQDEVPQEDNTALAVWALLACARSGYDPAALERFREPVARAVAVVRERTIHPHACLPITHTSIHETSVSEGFEIWNACAHARALRDAGQAYGEAAWCELGDLVVRAVGSLMAAGGRFVRRLDPHGHPDLRPDITLLAPWYFGLLAADDPRIASGARLIEQTLIDPALGGYTRYLTFSEEELMVFPGPWFFYTAWIAQYYADAGDPPRADAILRWILDHACDGELPELLITRHRFHFFRDVLARKAQGSPNARFRQAMLAELARLADRLRHDDVAPGVLPLLWSHVEMLRALRKRGYVKTFRTGLGGA